MHVHAAGVPPQTLQKPLREAAEALEANFLAEMLRHGGLGEARQSFGGGAGESAFAGMMTDEYAKLLASQGGIGLSEAIYHAMVERVGK